MKSNSNGNSLPKVVLASFILLGTGMSSGPVHAMIDMAGEELFAPEEAVSGQVRSPFKAEVLPIDPISKEAVDRVLLGPVYKAKSGKGFDHYRWVTFFNVDEYKSQVYQLHVHRENCGAGNSLPLASYTFSYTASAKIGVGINIEGVGLSADMTKSETLTTTQQVWATGNVVDHTPFMLKENWEGKTYLQTVDSKKGNEEIQLQERNSPPLWAKLMFPLLAHARQYPIPFKVENAVSTFIVEPKLIKKCESGSKKKGAVKQTQIATN
jgi:hypothetical protein